MAGARIRSHGLAVTLVLIVTMKVAGVSGAFGGAFQIPDQTWPHCLGCLDASTMTNACACTNGTAAMATLRVINDCVGNGDLEGGEVTVCGDSRLDSSGFGGVFQQDDPVPGGLGCRATNPFTGACSCPAGYMTILTRTLADGTSDTLVGSHLGWCLASSSSKPSQDAALAFGGVFQQRDDGVCMTANPVTGDCTCAPSSMLSPSPLRAIVDGPEGSLISLCVPAAPAPPATVTLCPGVTDVDATGTTDVSAQLQTCFSQLRPGDTLALPPGIYGLAHQVVLGVNNVVLRSAALDVDDTRICGADVTLPAGACPTLLALPGCCESGGLFRVADGVANVVVNHVLLDGNREARLTTPASAACISGDRSVAYNAHTGGCVNCSFSYFGSTRALCGTGFEYTGDSCSFYRCAFVANGNHMDKRWSDGLTLLSCPHGRVIENTFEDNSDVNFIMGCGTGTVVAYNTVTMHPGSACFAGFMMDNFDGGTCGDYTGAVITNTSIDCGVQQCDFGVDLGPHAWYPSANIVAGTVDHVTITGAKQGVQVGGAGSAAVPIVLTNLAVGPVPASAEFLCGTRSTSRLNIAPGSYVDRGGQTDPPATNVEWDNCP